jgi:hypothetical protein
MGLGSGIRKKRIPDPGSRGQKGTGSRIRIRNTVKDIPGSESEAQNAALVNTNFPNRICQRLEIYKI